MRKSNLIYREMLSKALKKYLLVSLHSSTKWEHSTIIVVVFRRCQQSDSEIDMQFGKDRRLMLHSSWNHNSKWNLIWIFRRNLQFSMSIYIEENSKEIWNDMFNEYLLACLKDLCRCVKDADVWTICKVHSHLYFLAFVNTQQF